MARTTGETLTLWVNQGWREATVVAVVKDTALIEYEMPAHSTAMVLEKANGATRSFSLLDLIANRKWCRAVTEAGIGIRPNPQGSGLLVRALVRAGILLPQEGGAFYFISPPPHACSLTVGDRVRFVQEGGVGPFRIKERGTVTAVLDGEVESGMPAVVVQWDNWPKPIKYAVGYIERDLQEVTV